MTDASGSDGTSSGRSTWWVWILAIIAGSVLVTNVFHTPGFSTFLALCLGAVIFRVGWFFLQQFATPPPPPPDPGTLRKVKLHYRCPSCGAEVKMTAAAVEDPEPPRHCMEDMDLVSAME